MTGLELLADFTSNCVFLHDDWNPSIGFSDWDYYDTNPFLLGADVCVVESLKGFGKLYLEYLRDNAILPSTIIVPQRRSEGFWTLTERLAADSDAITQLRRSISSNNRDLSVFYRYDDASISSIQQELFSVHPDIQIHPNRNSFIQADNRISCWKLLQRAGIPLPWHKICDDSADLIRFAQEANGKGFSKVILKVGHRKSKVIDYFNLETLNAAELVFPLIAEVVCSVLLSPVSQAIRWKGRTQYLFTLEQQISDFHFAGNRSLPTQWKSIEQSCVELLNRVHALFPQHQGVFGIDLILTDDNQLLVVDVNPRFNSSTYPFYFLHSRNKMGENRIGYYGMAENTSLTCLSDLYLTLGKFAYDSSSHKGILLFNPVSDYKIERLQKWSYLIVSENEAEESEFLRQIQSIIGSDQEI